jgi:SAM-dependent methyltransferase
MWKKVVRRFRRTLRPMRALTPYKYVRDRDAEEFGWYNLKTGELLRGFPVGGEDVVVDVGCGDGPSVEFAALQGAEVYAVDIDPAAIANVRRRLQDIPQGRPCHTLVSDCDPLPLDDGVATRVICQEVMEHVDDPRRFIAELVRIGRPGARYLLTVPDPASETLQRALAPECYWRKPNHLRVFGRDEFDWLVRDAGLTIEWRGHYSFYWSMWWALFWSGHGDFEFGSAGTRVLKYWNKTWAALMAAPKGAHVRKALNDFMPKSQLIIARKAG